MGYVNVQAALEEGISDQHTQADAVDRLLKNIVAQLAVPNNTAAVAQALSGDSTRFSKLVEQRPTVDQRTPEQRAADDQRTADQRTADQRTADQRTADQRTADQRAADLRK